jgi:adenylate kinase
MDSGELVPDALILDLVREHLGTIAEDSSVLFDGFPRTTAQADRLDDVLTSTGRRVDLVVLFTAPDETLIKRLSGRRSCPDCGAVFNTYFSPPPVEGVCGRCAGTLVHRADDEPETVARRLDVYREQTAPLVAYYQAHPTRMVEVRADRSADEVYAEFHDAVVAGAA